MSLPTRFDSKTVEPRIYQFWLDRRDFAPAEEEGKPPFVVALPPPNVTGSLHMGHCLNSTLQDVLIRYKRMQKIPTLWVPGTDHAGIATQHVVEKQLRALGLQREKIGRETFLKKAWEVKETYHSIITQQQQATGISCDWSRERFTLDPGLSQAVREVFVRLHEKNLIYRGEYLVNWCPSCVTALSDEEVDHREIKGELFYILYPFSDREGGITIATTRPETLLGDTAVAVHPEDPRYRDKIGAQLRLPLTERLLTLIEDAHCDPEFGSGAVKVTPGHDPNDWNMGKRHGLVFLNILSPKGTLNENVPKAYQGLDVKSARSAVVADLESAGLLVSREEHLHQVGHCSRCQTMIQPFLSKQWFVKTRPLAEKALSAWTKGEIQFFPKRWENTYKYWLENIRDWCISRQLWWGHQIPAWYCQRCSHVTVARHDPDVCESCRCSEIVRDPDVLDTWFSSWLWPFSIFGWPDKTADLEKFFPTSTVVSGYDILFFWIARMVMASLEITGQVPFKDICLTPLIRDAQGRKMSKSLGNGIDPLEVIDQYGADALRFSLSYMSVQGQDFRIDKQFCKTGAKLCTKVWNASRFILTNLEGRTLLPEEKIAWKDPDRWIAHRLNETVEIVERQAANYRFDEMAHSVYEFFWSDLCDWYLEISKIDLYSGERARQDRAASLLLLIWRKTLALLHPLIPFITEEIWGALPQSEGSLATTRFPFFHKEHQDFQLAESFSTLQSLIQAIWGARSEFAISPNETLDVRVQATDPKWAPFLKEHLPLIAALTRSTVNLALPKEGTLLPQKGTLLVSGKSFEVALLIGGLIDVEKEIARLQKSLIHLEKQQAEVEARLRSPSFTSRAPASIVAKEKKKLAEFQELLKKKRRSLSHLQN